jgi:hypothetical protein
MPVMVKYRELYTPVESGSGDGATPPVAYR